MPRQQIEIRWVFFAKPLSRAKAVNDHAVAAISGVFDAIEDLQRGRRVAIGIVSMRLKAEPGIGEVGRIDLGPDFEMTTVIRFPDIAEKVDYIE